MLDVRLTQCDHASPTKPRPLLDLWACDRLGSTSVISVGLKGPGVSPPGVSPMNDDSSCCPSEVGCH